MGDGLQNIAGFGGIVYSDFEDVQMPNGQVVSSHHCESGATGIGM